MDLLYSERGIRYMHNKNKGNKRSHRQKSVAKPQTPSPSLAAPLSAGTPAPASFVALSTLLKHL
jgi:hypothetical protein